VHIHALDVALAPSPELLGSGAYPGSQVTHDGATYFLARSGNATEQLLAVADDPSVLDRCNGEGRDPGRPGP
jgi:hypothetical protein